MVWDRRMYGMKCLFFGGMLYIMYARVCIYECFVGNERTDRSTGKNKWESLKI